MIWSGTKYSGLCNALERNFSERNGVSRVECLVVVSIDEV